MRPRPELRQLLIGISTSRYLPASGTAGLDRSFVSGNSRVPAPPPMMIASVLFWREYKSIRSEFLADSLLGTLQASRNFVTMIFFYVRHYRLHRAGGGYSDTHGRLTATGVSPLRLGLGSVVIRWKNGDSETRRTD